jgi:hypothetical protein
MDDLRTLVRGEMARAGAPAYSFDDLGRRRDRKRRDQRITAGVVGIAVFVATVWLVTTAGSSGRTAPADEPTVREADAATRVALGFLGAYAAFDAQEAMTYVAEGADLSGVLDDADQVPATTEGLSMKLSLLRAVGYEQTVTSCVAAAFGSDTSVICDYDFHALGSDRIGRGPFSGNSYVFTVRDGAILRIGQAWGAEGFDHQMWWPFAEWVSSTYPEDAAVMYLDGTRNGARFSPESIRLWERHTREYVEEVQQGTA